jgi:hypothetical protein
MTCLDCGVPCPVLIVCPDCAAHRAATDPDWLTVFSVQEETEAPVHPARAFTAQTQHTLREAVRRLRGGWL